MRKNIAIIIPKLTGGGAEKVAANLSIGLQKKYNTNIFVYNDDKITYDYTGNLVSINDQQQNSAFGKIINFIRRIRVIRKLKEYYDINYTISFMENPNFVNILSRVKDRIIISIRIYKSVTPNDIYGKINKLFMKILYNKADYIIAVSEEIKNDLIQNFGLEKTKIKVIYNGYDIEKINKLGNESLENNFNDFFNGKVITTMGRLEYQKGQWHLINAFAKVKKQIPDAKLLIIGQGSLKNDLINLTKKLKLINDVMFVDYTTNPFKYIQKSSLFVLPSLYEGFPNALCEAMASGLPVISTDFRSGVARDIIKEKNGILVPIGDKPALSNAMRTILSDSRLQMLMSNNNRKLIRKLSEEKIVDQWIKLFDRVLSDG